MFNCGSSQMHLNSVNVAVCWLHGKKKLFVISLAPYIGASLIWSGSTPTRSIYVLISVLASVDLTQYPMRSLRKPGSASDRMLHIFTVTSGAAKTNRTACRAKWWQYGEKRWPACSTVVTMSTGSVESAPLEALHAMCAVLPCEPSRLMSVPLYQLQTPTSSGVWLSWFEMLKTSQQQ